MNPPAESYLSVRTILLLSVGGILGANARYLLARLVSQNISHELPLGTIAVNILGALLAGFIVAVLSDRFEGVVSEQLRMFLVVGFLGSFTTFSAIQIETLKLMTEGHYLSAAINSLGSAVLGLLAAGFGYWLGAAR